MTTNLSDGYYMHFQVTESQMKKFQIPANIDFWSNTCPSDGDADEEELFYEFSLILLVCSSLLLFS